MLRPATLRSFELCRRAGITYKQLDHWTRLGLLETVGPALPGHGAQREFSEREVAVARFLVVVVPWLGHGSRLSRVRVRDICQLVRFGVRGTVVLVEGVTVDLDLVCGAA